MRKTTVFKRARLTKSQSKPVISDWIDLFMSKDLMSLILPLMHLYDIIHLAMTCKRFIGFYGTKMTKILCEAVKRDCNVDYVNHPLKYLGKLYNLNPKENGHFYVNRCRICSRGLSPSRPELEHDINHIWCNSCESLFDQIRNNILYHKSVPLIVKMFAPQDQLRALRLIKRTVECLSFNSHKWMPWYKAWGMLGENRIGLIKKYYKALYTELYMSDLALKEHPNNLNRHGLIYLNYRTLMAELYFISEINKFIRDPQVKQMTPDQLVSSAQRLVDSIEW